MTQFKGTQTPWSIEKDEFNNNLLISNGRYLAEIINKQDALLISKAPEMLEMLEKCKSTLKDHFGYDVDEIEQLIKEATEI